MYRKNNKEQMTIEDFFLPFGGKLDAGNRWVKLSEITPWERIEEYYLQSMSQETGRGAIPARIAFGAVSLRQSERISDEETVRYIPRKIHMSSTIWACTNFTRSHCLIRP